MNSSKKNKQKSDEEEKSYDPNFTPDYPSRQKRRKKPVFEYIIDGLNLIIIGLLLLLNTTGIVGWGVWWRILLILLKLWPLMIIWIGIQIVLSWSKLLRIIGKAVGLVIFVSIVMVASSAEMNDDNLNWFEKNFPFFSKITVDKDQTETQLTIPANKYEKKFKTRNLDLKLTAGSIRMKDNNSSTILNLSAYHYKDFGEPELKDNLKNSALNIQFEPKFKTRIFNFLDREIEYDFEIGKPDITTNINLDMTAGKSDLTFDELDLDKLKLKMTAGDFDADFTDRSLPSEFEIDLTAGDCKIRIPSDTQVDLDYQITAGSLKFGDEEFNWGKGSEKFNQNASRSITFDVHITAGAVKIEYI